MKKIVLLESNKKHSKIIADHLRKLGNEVYTSWSGADAKEILNQLIPDLIIASSDSDITDILDLLDWMSKQNEIENIPKIFIVPKDKTDQFPLEKNKKYIRIFEKPIDVSKFNNAVLELINFSKKKTSLISDYSSLIGKRIGSVIIEKEIARGGMGVVLLGHQESLDRKVAVKILLAGDIDDSIAMERFEREARATALLKSPHIVQIYDFGKMDDRTFYIIMEYLPGETVQKYIYSRTRISIKECVSIVKQVATGLKKSHESGLIHRDIKPSNLIINIKGEVTITDFGLVKPQKKVTETVAGAIFGTPMYISPEQINSKKLDARTDIYSLGIIFYQLLAGEPPFTSPNPVELMMNHLKKPLPEITKKNPDVSPEIRRILLKMTNKEREKRYINCSDLLKDLNALTLKDTAPYFTNKLETPSGIYSDHMKRDFSKGHSSKIFTSSIEKIPQGTMSKMERELAKGIGPIAKVVLKKEIKKMGFGYDSFPRGSVIPLVEKLLVHIDSKKREKIIKNIEDIIFTKEE